LSVTQSNRRWTRPLFFLVVFAFIFHNFWSHSLIFFDSFRLYAPLKYHVAQGWASFRVVGWNPYQLLGMPLVADILAGYFYPLNLIYVLLPFEPAHRLFILIHYPMAAIFMDLLSRELSISRRASLLAALAFPLSGYMISQHANLTFLIGPAWAPLALFCMIRALKGSIRWALGAGAVLAMQVLAGEPQSAALTAALVALFGLGAASRGERRGRALGAVAAAGLSSIALAAAQLLPTCEMMRLSVRSGGMALDKAAKLSFHPLRAIELIWPTPFGVQWPEQNFWGWFSFDTALLDHPWSLTNYLGLPVLALAVVGVFSSRRPWKKWAGLGMLFFFLLALGRHTPVYGLLHKWVPLFDLFRFPAKYMEIGRAHV